LIYVLCTAHAADLANCDGEKRCELKCRAAAAAAAAMLCSWLILSHSMQEQVNNNANNIVGRIDYKVTPRRPSSRPLSAGPIKLKHHPNNRTWKFSQALNQPVPIPSNGEPKDEILVQPCFLPFPIPPQRNSAAIRAWVSRPQSARIDHSSLAPHPPRRPKSARNTSVEQLRIFDQQPKDSKHYIHQLYVNSFEHEQQLDNYNYSLNQPLTLANKLQPVDKDWRNYNDYIPAATVDSTKLKHKPRKALIATKNCSLLNCKVEPKLNQFKGSKDSLLGKSLLGNRLAIDLHRKLQQIDQDENKPNNKQSNSHNSKVSIKSCGSTFLTETKEEEIITAADTSQPSYFADEESKQLIIETSSDRVREAELLAPAPSPLTSSYQLKRSKNQLLKQFPHYKVNHSLNNHCKEEMKGRVVDSHEALAIGNGRVFKSSKDCAVSSLAVKNFNHSSQGELICSTLEYHPFSARLFSNLWTPSSILSFAR
jgi:hypothetical protein